MFGLQERSTSSVVLESLCQDDKIIDRWVPSKIVPAAITSQGIWWDIFRSWEQDTAHGACGEEFDTFLVSTGRRRELDVEGGSNHRLVDNYIVKERRREHSIRGGVHQLKLRSTRGRDAIEPVLADTRTCGTGGAVGRIGTWNLT